MYNFFLEIFYRFKKEGFSLEKSLICGFRKLLYGDFYEGNKKFEVFFFEF